MSEPSPEHSKQTMSRGGFLGHLGLLAAALGVGLAQLPPLFRPNASRPYKALGYPILPALYIVLAAWICIVLLRYKPQYTWPGLVLVLLGIPVYLFWSWRLKKFSEPNLI